MARKKDPSTAWALGIVSIAFGILVASQAIISILVFAPARYTYEEIFVPAGDDSRPGTYMLVPDDPSEECGTHLVERKSYSIVGLNLWRYSSNTAWCWKNGLITESGRRPPFQAIGHATASLWEFLGNLSEDQSEGEGWGPGSNSQTDHAQGNFRYCPWFFGCMQDLAFIEKWQYGDGTYTFDMDRYGNEADFQDIYSNIFRAILIGLFVLILVVAGITVARKHSTSTARMR